ncbi:MAG: hypothetical protein JWO20_1063 [Candidatus Angelobacter sp.]|nr:hypothetical protein [Candidatus Angelobacter sp.]
MQERRAGDRRVADRRESERPGALDRRKGPLRGMNRGRA